MAKLKITLLADAEKVVRGGPRQARGPEPGLMEAAIFQAFEQQGHVVSVIAARNPISTLIGALADTAPDIVFNLAHRYDGDRRKAAHIAALLDVLRIPYTGAGPQGILRACDKALSKHLVRMIGVKVPRFAVVPRGAVLRDHGLEFPVIVKPRFDGGSAGITDPSPVHRDRELRARVRLVHRRHCQDAVCEELIAGREVSAGLIGNGEPHVFPFRERILPGNGRREMPLADRRIERDRSRSNCRQPHWRRLDMSAARVARLAHEARLIYRELQLRDFARIDFRLAPSGELYFIEAGHCPDCAPKSFGMLGEGRSLAFPRLLELIIVASLERYRRRGGLPRSTAARLRRISAGLGDAVAQIR
jgi:D-alanine-D-alanine ligase